MAAIQYTIPCLSNPFRLVLDNIVGTSTEIKDDKDLWSWKSQDFENNIIAFCGERGEGKSSVMMSFVNAVYKDRKNEIFTKCTNL